MSKSLSVQIINGPDGAPAFVVIPYAEYMAQRNEERDLIPHAVVSATVDGATPLRVARISRADAGRSRDAARHQPVRPRSTGEQRETAQVDAREDRRRARHHGHAARRLTSSRPAAKSRQALRCRRLFFVYFPCADWARSGTAQRERPAGGSSPQVRQRTAGPWW